MTNIWKHTAIYFEKWAKFYLQKRWSFFIYTKTTNIHIL